MSSTDQSTTTRASGVFGGDDLVRKKGWALGLNAADGTSAPPWPEFVVRIAITVGAAGTVNLGLAGFLWIPLILVAVVGAYRYMDKPLDGGHGPPSVPVRAEGAAPLGPRAAARR